MALSAGRADSLPEGDGHCTAATEQRAGRESPPTLLLPEQEGVNGIRFPIWLDRKWQTCCR
ncbi:hypothetical protein ACNKHV_15875 [Shigella flexneri]